MVGKRLGVASLLCLAGCTSIVSTPPVTPGPTGIVSTTAAQSDRPALPIASPPSALDGPAVQPCISLAPGGYNPGRLDDDMANPGTRTTLRVFGVEPNRRFEVWQSRNMDGQPCTWHPRDAEGIKLGDASSDGKGRITFPFQVADVPAGHVEAEKALWLVTPDDGHFTRAIAWTSTQRTQLSGRLYGEDGQPYTQPVTVDAQFYARQGLSELWLVDERTVTTSGGNYRFDNVPAPVRVDLRVRDGDWLLASVSRSADYFIDQWRGHSEEGRQPWDRPFGSPLVVDFGSPPTAADPYTRNYAIPLWSPPPTPAPAPPATPTIDPMFPPTCPRRYSADALLGQVDNPWAYGSGDRTTLRVRKLPPNTQFQVWQADTMVGNKVPCVDAKYFDGVQIGRATSDAQGKLVQPLSLVDIPHSLYSFETLLWLVWPDGVTTQPVAQWSNLRPSPLSGKLYGDDGQPFTRPVNVELHANLSNRTVRLTTNAVGGTYQFTDVPAPVDLELDVFDGARRLARRRVSAYEVSGKWGQAGPLVPKQGPPITADFGGPGSELDPLATRFPLITTP